MRAEDLNSIPDPGPVARSYVIGSYGGHIARAIQDTLVAAGWSIIEETAAVIVFDAPIAAGVPPDTDPKVAAQCSPWNVVIDNVAYINYDIFRQFPLVGTGGCSELITAGHVGVWFPVSDDPGFGVAAFLAAVNASPFTVVFSGAHFTATSKIVGLAANDYQWAFVDSWVSHVPAHVILESPLDSFGRSWKIMLWLDISVAHDVFFQVVDDGFGGTGPVQTLWAPGYFPHFLVPDHDGMFSSLVYGFDIVASASWLVAIGRDQYSMALPSHQGARDGGALTLVQADLPNAGPISGFCFIVRPVCSHGATGAMLLIDKELNSHMRHPLYWPHCFIGVDTAIAEVNLGNVDKIVPSLLQLSLGPNSGGYVVETLGSDDPFMSPAYFMAPLTPGGETQIIGKIAGGALLHQNTEASDFWHPEILHDGTRYKMMMSEDSGLVQHPQCSLWLPVPESDVPADENNSNPGLPSRIKNYVY